MLKKDIGTNAGIIWQLLSEKGKLSIKEIVKQTKMNEVDVNLALGWLSKEHKICFIEKNNTTHINLIDSSTCAEMYY